MEDIKNQAKRIYLVILGEQHHKISKLVILNTSLSTNN